MGDGEDEAWKKICGNKGARKKGRSEGEEIHDTGDSVS